MADINWQQVLASIAPLITGGMNLNNPNAISGMGDNLADIADPFRHERPQYMDQLRALMTGPNQAADFLKDPSALHSSGAWQSGMAAGSDAVNRAAGSRGMAASGNRLTDLYSFGNRYDQGWQDQIYKQLMAGRDQQFGELALTSGASSGSPGTAANGAAAGTQQTGQNIGAGVGGIASGIGSLLNSGVFGKLFDLMKGAGIDTTGLQDLLKNPGNDDWQGWLDQINNTPGDIPGWDELINHQLPNFDIPDLGTFDPIDLSTIFGP